MATVDEVDKIRTALMEYAGSFFHGVRGPDEVYARFVMAFNAMRDEMIELNNQGKVTPGLAEAWSWYSIVVPAMLRVIFSKGGNPPKWGTRELEQQLNDAFIEQLRGSKTTSVNHADAPPVSSPIGIVHTEPADAGDDEGLELPRTEGSGRVEH